MAYEVTATRRRPKTFDELAGQEFVVATLKSSIDTGRIAHAYLFSGPRGCGKTSAARILARSLNCEKAGPDGPCGTCSACVEIARGANMDVIEIDGASNTSVNDVRQIKDEILFPPNAGKYKIYIIDEVHMLSNSAFNALLKTIEEPPPYIIFIFATTELHKVPATIKSRCQQFAFRLIPMETIRDILSSACVEMGIKAEDEALYWIARESTGSLRDAYTLFDQVVAFSNGELTASLIREKLGLTGLEAIDALAEACTRGDHASVFGSLDDILQRGVSVEQLVVDLAEYYRSLLLIKSGIDKESIIGCAPSRYSALNREKLSIPQLHHAVELLLRLYRDIRFSVSARFELEAVVAALTWLPSWVSMEELSQAVEGLRSIVAGEGLSGGFPPPGGAPGPFAVEPVARAGAIGGGAVTPPVASWPASPEPVMPEPLIHFDENSSITETFKRFIAQKAGKAAEPSGPVGVAVPAAPEGVLDRANEEGAAKEAPEVPDRKVSVEELVDDAAEDRLGDSAANSTGDDGFLADLKASLEKSLRRERGMLSSAIAKTDSWTMAAGTLTMTVREKLTAELLERETPWLSGELGRMLGSPISLAIKLSLPAAVKAVVSVEQSLAVENVCRLFKGTIVRT